MPKRSKSSGSRAVLALMLVAAMGVGGLAAYVKLNPAARHVPEDLRRSNSEAPEPREPLTRPRTHRRGPDVSVSQTPDETGLRIPSVVGMEVKLGDPAPPIPDDQDPKVFMATQTMAAVKVEGAKALGVTVKDRNAIIDCSPALEDGVGTNQEASLIKAMQMGLGQFDDIDTFQFSVDGHILDTLGALDLKDPIPVTRASGKSAPSDKNSRIDPD